MIFSTCCARRKISEALEDIITIKRRVAIMNICDQITEQFYKVFYLNEDISQLESWIYDTDEIEKTIGSDLYLEIISIDFNKKDSKHEVGEKLRPFVDFQRIEKKNIMDILEGCLIFAERQGVLLGKLYELYCNGYYFLFDLAIGFGLPCLGASDYPCQTWDELKHEEKLELLSKFQGKLEPIIKCNLEWIDEGKIVFLGARDNIGNWQYEDNRSMDEKESTIARGVSR